MALTSPTVARADSICCASLVELLVVSRQFVKIASSGTKRGLGGGAAFVKLIEGAHGGGVELLSIGQHALFGFERFVFAGDEIGGADLLGLVAPEVDHAETVLLIGQQFVELGLRGAPRFVCCGYIVGRDGGKAIKQNALLGLVEAGKRLRLRVHEGEFGRKLAKNGDGSWLVVDEDAAFAASTEFRGAE